MVVVVSCYTTVMRLGRMTANPQNESSVSTVGARPISCRVVFHDVGRAAAPIGTQDAGYRRAVAASLAASPPVVIA